MFEGQVAKLAGREIFPQEDLFKIVHGHAKWGAIAMALPLPIADTILYIIVLWHMYNSLSERAHKPLSFGAGILVNIFVCVVVCLVDEALDWIPIIGWFISAFIVYIQFYMSGKAYIEVMKS
ncbi:MAG: hypothetical protein MJZ00_00475 [Paludibacteraceae bacterium]|nr:hypothetical protein [Paludibacteraceae bacterium]